MLVVVVRLVVVVVVVVVVVPLVTHASLPAAARRLGVGAAGDGEPRGAVGGRR